MKNKKHKNYLFTDSGCLSLGTMQKYLENELTFEEKSQVEKHLSGCDFCKDALDGLRHVEDTEKLTETISTLNKNIQVYVSKTRKSRRFAGIDRKIKLNYAYISIAASVLIIIGIFSYFSFFKDRTKEFLAEQTEDFIAEPFEKSVDTNQLAYTEPEKAKSEPSRVKGVKEIEKEEVLALPLETPPQKIEGTISLTYEKKEDSVINPPEVIEALETMEKEAHIKAADEIILVAMEEDDMAGIKMADSERAKKEVGAIAKRTVADEIFADVEEMPRFQRKEIKSFEEYIEKELRYPAIALENGISGTVYVQFIVNTDGKVSDVKVEKSVDPVLDKEAIRVISSSPKWIPGKQKGKPVKVSLTYPVHFIIK